MLSNVLKRNKKLRHKMLSKYQKPVKSDLEFWELLAYGIVTPNPEKKVKKKTPKKKKKM